MVKVFQLGFPVTRPNPYTFTSGSQSATYSNYSYPDGDTSIIVIANTIKEVAEKYPNANHIMEIEAKDVVILDSVKIVCPVRK